MKDGMKRTHQLLGSLGLLSLLLSIGCAAPQVREPVVSRTTVDRIQAHAISFSSFQVEAEVVVPPAASERMIQEASYEVLVGDDLRPMASGTNPVGASIPADGGVVNLQATSDFAPPEELSAIFTSGRPVQIIFRGALHQADGDSFEFTKATHIRSPRVPPATIYHVEASTQQGPGRQPEIALIFFLRLENQNPFQLQFNQLKFQLEIEGKKMVEGGQAGSATVVPASANAELRIEYILNSQNFPQIDEVVRARRPLGYRIDGDIELSVGYIPVQFQGNFTLGGS